MIISCEPAFCSEHMAEIRSQRLHCTKGGWGGGCKRVNGGQRRAQTQMLAIFPHTVNTRQSSIEWVWWWLSQWEIT